MNHESLDSTQALSPLLICYRGIRPTIADDAWIAPNATVTGDTEIGAQSSIWFGCIVRGTEPDSDRRPGKHSRRHDHPRVLEGNRHANRRRGFDRAHGAHSRLHAADRQLRRDGSRRNGRGGLRDVPVHGARIRRVGTTVPGRPPEVLIPSRLSTGWVRPLASETDAHASRRGAVPAAWVEVTSRTAELPVHPISKHPLLPLGAKIAFAAGAFRAGPFRTFSPPKLTSPVRLQNRARCRARTCIRIGGETWKTCRPASSPAPLSKMKHP